MEHRLLVWFKPVHLKGDRYYVGYQCIHYTTQPLHQGTGKAGKMRPEELLAVARFVFRSLPVALENKLNHFEGTKGENQKQFVIWKCNVR